MIQGCRSGAMSSAAAEPTLSPWALAGYLGGMGVYLLESKFLLGAAEVTATLPAALPLLPGGGP